MAEPQIRWNITAVDRSRVAFASFAGNVQRADRQMRAFVNTIRGGAAFAAGIIVVQQLGKAIDRDLGGKGKEFGDKWKVAINDWQVQFQSSILTIALGIDKLIEKAQQWRASLPKGTEMTGSGFVFPSNVLRQGEEAAGINAPLNGLGPQSQNKGDRLDMTPENTTVSYLPGRTRVPSVSRSRSGSGGSGFNFERDVLRGLEEEIRLLEARNRTMGMSEGATEALVTKERALNEIRAQGREPTAAEIAAIEKRTQKIGQLTDAMDAFRKAEEAAKERKDAFLDLSEQGVDALSSIVMHGERATDVIKNLGLAFSDAALKAALLGRGPLAGLFGNSNNGGLLGSLLNSSSGTPAVAGAGTASGGVIART